MQYPALHSCLPHEDGVKYCQDRKIVGIEVNYYHIKHISYVCVYVSSKTKIKLKLYFITVADMKIQCRRLNCSYGCKENGSNTHACFCQSGYSLADDAKACKGTQYY